MTEEELKAIWGKIKEEVKRRKVDLALWGGLDACVVVGEEEGRLVLGLDSEDYHRLGHLTTVLSRRVVEEVLREVVQEITSFEVISGTTAEEWEQAKERERVRRRAVQEALERRRAVGDAAERWNVLSEELVRRHAATQQRNLPQVMAAFLLESLKEVHRVEEELGEQAGSELAQRNVARVLHKLSAYTGVDPVSVALEYGRLREREKRRGE